MYRVLIYGLTDNPGGMENFVLNYVSRMDWSRIHFDFLCDSNGKIAYEKEFRRLGAKMFRFPKRSQHPLKHKIAVESFYRNYAKDYDAIWSNVCLLSNIECLKLGKKYGIKKRILHSHNSQSMGGKLREILHEQHKRNIEDYATDFWACSPEAAKWAYPERLLPSVKVIPNAIDVGKYCFDSEKREALRKELGIGSQEYVIGNVGRLHFQKNQEFLLKIGAAVLEKLPETRIVLVGQGEDEAKLKDQARELGIADRVLFAGVQSDIQAWLSVMDIFVLPSLFEGLPLSALEAQANGLPVVLAENLIDPDTKILDSCTFLNLEDDAKIWAAYIVEQKKTNHIKRTEQSVIENRFREHRFDIKCETTNLMDLILEGKVTGVEKEKNIDKKYQIVPIKKGQNNAGTKANADITTIADRLGFEHVEIHTDNESSNLLKKIRRLRIYHRDWKYAFTDIKENAVVLLQHPFHFREPGRNHILKKLKDEKKIKYICLIHDVEALRGFRDNRYYKTEFQNMMKIADVFIVHNDIMKNYFVKLGVDEHKIVTLEIFDYLLTTETDKMPQFERSITIAGNLDIEKSSYIKHLGDVSNLRVHLYGPNYDHRLDNFDNLRYHGSWPPDEVPGQLTHGFGLVWDGDSTKYCSGSAGQYLRYNNPHKLSLYLASGIPVVIWKKAALALFVKKNRLGICVESLEELPEILESIDETKYKLMAENVKNISAQLKSGEFGLKAILKAEEILRHKA